MIFVAQGLGLGYLLYHDMASEKFLTALTGASPFLALMALQIAAVWGSEAELVDDLKHGDTEEQNGKIVHPTMNEETRHLFPALSAFASLLFIGQFILTFILIRFRDELCSNASPSTMIGGNSSSYNDIDDPSSLSKDLPESSGGYQTTSTNDAGVI
jgi:hypothetical protein